MIRLTYLNETYFAEVAAPRPESPRTARRREALTYAGIQSASFARSTGTLVVIIDGEAGEYDTEAGRWQTLCDDHGGICSHDTLALARSWASAPEEWCPYCQENRTEQEISR